MKSFSIFAIVVGLLGFMLLVSYSPDKKTPGEMKQMAIMPTNLNLDWTVESFERKFIVSVTSNLDPIGINKMHNWEVLVKTSKGAPVDGAKLTIVGGMPMHQHGMPTAPRVTKNLGQGRYLLEGMKFNMSGWWEMKIQIDAGSIQDKATVNLILK